MAVYLDVLLVVNWYVNFFLLLGTARLTHSHLSAKRAAASAAAGAVLALELFLPPLGSMLTLALKLGGAFLLVWLAFGCGGGSRYFSLVLVYFLVSSIFAGLMLAVCNILPAGSGRMAVNNGTFYLDISLFTLLISTAAAYGTVGLFRRLLDRKAAAGEEYQIILTVNRKTLVLHGLADSGNTLVDAFSGKRVVVCSQKRLEEAFPNGFPDPSSDELIKHDPAMTRRALPKGAHFIPCSTIQSSGLIWVFPPEHFYLKGEHSGKIKEADALIGVGGLSGQEGEAEAVFHPSLLL